MSKDNAAYVIRLETAIRQSSEAMAVLREENAALVEENRLLKSKIIALEKGKDGPSVLLSTSGAKASQLSRNKKSFASGIKLDSRSPLKQPTNLFPGAETSVGSKSPEESLESSKRKFPFNSVSLNQGPDKKQCDMTKEELDVADEFDKEFDNMSSSSDSSSDESAGEPPSSEYSKDKSNMNTDGYDTISTADSADGHIDSDESEHDSDDSFTSSLNKLDHRALSKSEKRNLTGYSKIDLSSSDHANLQILKVLEALSKENIHTASLLLCNFARAPVAEILCKRIRTVAEEEVNSWGDSLNHMHNNVQSESIAYPPISENSWSFIENIMRLLESISHRSNSGGPAKCSFIMSALNDYLLTCWYPTVSTVDVGRWKRKGLLDVQIQRFFGNSNASSSGNFDSFEAISHQLISEFIVAILMHVGYRQGRCHIMKSTIKLYLYASQYSCLLGCARGFLGSLLSGGNSSAAFQSYGHRPENGFVDFFEANKLVTDLLNWNVYEMCHLCQSLYYNVSKCSVMLGESNKLVSVSRELYNFCVSKTSKIYMRSFSEEICEGSSLLGYIDDVEIAIKHFSMIVMKSYECHWRDPKHDTSSISQSIFDKWKNCSIFDANETVASDISIENFCSMRFGSDILLTLSVSRSGLWKSVSCFDTKAFFTQPGIKDKNIFHVMGLNNVNHAARNIFTLNKILDESGEDCGNFDSFKIISDESFLFPWAVTFKSNYHIPSSRPGIEQFFIHLSCSNWDLLMKDNLAEPNEEMELEIIQQMHTVYAIFNCAMVPFYPLEIVSSRQMGLESSLDECVSKCKAMMLKRQIPLLQCDSVSSDFSTLEIFRAVSVSPIAVKSSVVVIYSCMSRLSEDKSLLDDAFKQCLQNLVASVSFVVFELLLFIIVCSIRGLLSCCRMRMLLLKDSDQTFHLNTAHPLIRLSQEASMILIQMHHAWFCSANKSRVLLDIAETIKSYNVAPGSVFVPGPTTNWIWSQTFSRIPALVINLDVRDTRWRKMLDQCNRHSVFPIRVAAIDARKGQDYSRQDTGNNRNNNSIIGSSEDIIDEKVVKYSWDSTLNAKFDKKCLPNTSIAMTPSERACAASHVTVWNFVYNIFVKDSSPPPELSQFLRQLGQDSMSSGSKNYCRPLPSRETNDLIPKLWLNRPRPRYQCQPISETDRVAEIQANIDVLLRFNFYCEKFFLVLEDDAIFDPRGKSLRKSMTKHSKKLSKKSFMQRLKDIADKIPADFDICYLGYNGNVEKKSVKKIFVKPIYVWGLHAYLLSPKGAAKLLTQLPVSAPVDIFIANLIKNKKIEAYAVPLDAQLARQEGSDTNHKPSSDIVHSSSTR